MAWQAAVAEAVGDVFSSIVDIWATGKTLEEQRAARQEARELAGITRADTLEQNRIANELAQAGLQLQRNQLAMQGEQFREQQRFAERQYNNQQIKDLASTIQSRANASPTYRQQVLQLWGA